MNRTNIFISYSHQDRKWLYRLLDVLSPLVSNGSINLWSDANIQPGQHWRDEIDKALTSATMAILLVSHHYLASAYIDNTSCQQF